VVTHVSVSEPPLHVWVQPAARPASAPASEGKVLVDGGIVGQVDEFPVAAV
jgi:hypothetical protein